MSKLRAGVLILFAWIGQSIVGGIAWLAITNTAPSPLRDAFLVLIWPIVIVAGTVLAWRWIGRDAVDPAADAQRVAQMEAELAERHHRERNQRLAELVRAFEHERDSFVNLNVAEANPNREPEAWGRVEASERSARNVIGDNAEDLAEYDRPVDPATLMSAQWNIRVSAYFEIKRHRLMGMRRPP